MILISYFSASGVTKSVAEKIKEVVGGDIFSIDPLEPYTKEDLDWRDDNNRCTVEMRDRIKPKIKEKVKDIDKYNIVIIGYPIWWYTAPTIINTFIEENNLEGKDIYLFVTSHSSTSNKSYNDLQEEYPNLRFIKSIRFTKDVNKEEILNFIN